MNEFKQRSAAIQERIADMEQTLATLKSQLLAEEEREQHAAIDRLEEYLGDLDNKHANLQDFWKILRGEVSGIFSKKTTKPEDDA